MYKLVRDKKGVGGAALLFIGSKSSNTKVTSTIKTNKGTVKISQSETAKIEYENDDNGFTDDYQGTRYQPITDDMYTSSIAGYIEK